MESDSNRTNLIIFMVLVFVLIGVTAIILISSLVNHESKMNNGNKDNTIVDDNPTTNVTTVYSGYEIGDKVTLNDNSTWHVIIESDINNEYVTILKDEALPTKMDKYSGVDYLNNEYRDELNETLNCEDEITDVHLISSEEIKTITRIGNPRKDTKLNGNDYDWLTARNTLTNIMNNEEIISICEKDTNTEASLCALDTDSYSIRPVIKINKNCLK